MEQIIYVDAGFSEGKGGQIAWYNETTDTSFYDKCDCADSFRCEVKAVLRAVQDHKEIMDTTQLRFLLDNEIVVDQLNRKAGINQDDTRSDFLKIWNLTSGKKVVFGWLPRKQNKAGKMLGS